MKFLTQQCFFLIVIFGTSLLLLLLSTREINMTYDSFEYLNAAKSFGASGKLLTRSGEPFTNWAPLFPLILANFGGDLEYYRYFNLMIYILLAIGIASLVASYIHDRRLQVLCSIWLAFSTQTLSQFNFLWSDSLFITVLIFKILCFLEFKRTDKIFYLIAMTALGILLCLQRYAGLFIIPAFTVLLVGWKISKYSLSRGFLYGVISILPTLIWMGLGYGQKGEGFSAFATNLFANFLPNLFRSYYQDIFFAWFFPHQLVFQLGYFYALIFLVFLLVSWKLKKFQLTTSQELLLSIILIYYFFLISIDYSLINETVEDFSHLSDLERYLDVIYIPVILLIFSILDQKINQFGKVHIKIIFAVLAIWTLYPIARATKNSILWRDYSNKKELSINYQRSIGIPF